MSLEQDEQDGLRARSEQAIGEIAQALIENPTLHNAISAAFGAREKAIEAGCDEFDIKPVEFERLLGKIRQLLGR